MVDLKEEEDCGSEVENDSSRSSSSSASSSCGQSGGSSSTTISISSEEEDAVAAAAKNKACTSCNTTTTPLWRGGPVGPKTLCNACGIKYYKKRRADLGLKNSNSKSDNSKISKKIALKKAKNGLRGGPDQKLAETRTITTTFPSASTSNSQPLKIVFRNNNDIGTDNGVGADTVGRKLGEEEQAAMLLMALSCGSVYA